LLISVGCILLMGITRKRLKKLDRVHYPKTNPVFRFVSHAYLRTRF
jgi:hypothetical protein